MAKRKLKEKALRLRKEGKSYSQIRKEIKVSKSTLSSWLRDYPLSEKRIKELRDNNPKRIENYRKTMRLKREFRQNKVYEKVKNDIDKLSKRDLFIAGLFLYWGEGLKSGNTATSISNTDSAMVKFFIKWLELFDVSRNKLKVKLHLYSDMDVEKEVNWWSKELGIPKKNFHKPYIKQTNQEGISYKNKPRHGTCNVIFFNRDVNEYVLAGVKRLKEIGNS